MPLQYITDASGINTAVLIPINEWELLTRKHEDLKNMGKKQEGTKQRLSQLAGKLSNSTADEMLNYVSNSRNEWEERTKK
jgi:hypothetical protein